MRSDCPELGTAIHADSPFNRLKAALNYDRHVVDKRDNAPVALTRRGLSSLVQDPAEMILFIQKEFMLKDGSRISFKAAVPLAFGVCTLFRTCAVALAVPRCTPRPTGDQCCRAFLAFPHCVWVSARISRYGGAACKPLAFSMLTGAHERRCAMVRCARWPRGYVHRRHPPILRLEPLQVRPRWRASRGGATAVAIAQRSPLQMCSWLTHNVRVSVVRRHPSSRAPG